MDNITTIKDNVIDYGSLDQTDLSLGTPLEQIDGSPAITSTNEREDLNFRQESQSEFESESKIIKIKRYRLKK